MQESIDTIKQPAIALRTPLKLANPAIWFAVGICLVTLVPIVSIAPWLQTFIHPWRAELTASLVLLGFLIWGHGNTGFRNYLSNIKRQEFFAIILPCFVFVVWSLLSAFYAGSWKSVMHHSLVWSIYLVFYIFVRFFVSRPAGSEILFLTLAAVVWMIGLPAVFEYYTTGISGGAGSIGVRYSKYAEMLTALFPIIAAYVLKLKGKSFWLGSATALLLWLFVISSLSRTAAGLYMIGTLLMTGLIFTFRRFRHYRLRFALLLAVLVIVPVMLLSVSYFTTEGVPILERMRYDSTQESNNVRPFFSRVALEMFKAYPLTGVGADNFGLEFNRYRGVYASANPGDRNLSIAESEIPERAHNEYLQIAAELGIPGILIFAFLLCGIAWLFFRAAKNRNKLSLSTFGALIGILLFLASSAVTSYSFRLVQNGFAFFILLALAAKGLLSGPVKESPGEKFSPLVTRLGFTAGIAACCLLAVFSVARAAAVWYVYQAESAVTLGAAVPLFQNASALDDQNASIYASRGSYLLRAEAYADAVPQFRKAIDLGRATTTDYSYLASVQILAGDKQAAQATLAEAVGVYPYSIFIRTRYAVLLKEAADPRGSAKEFEIAMSINPRQAEMWRNLIEDGAAVASRRSFDNNLVQVMDLTPKSAIYAMLAEREILHPEEKVTINFNGLDE
jgi:O-antigen ligase